VQTIGKVSDQELSDPLKYRALLDKSSVLLSLPQFKEARQTGEAALALNATSADIYGVLVDASVELGDYQSAILYADKMAGIRPDLRSYSRVSYLRETHGLVRESIEAMKLAVAAGYPGMEQTEWARLTLGHLYERYGSLDSAMMQYQIALNERPNYPFAIAAMARIHDANGQRHAADSLNEVARKLIPEVSFFVDKATWEMNHGNKTKADALTKEILVMLADDEQAGHKMSMEMAKVYLHLRTDPDQALTYALSEYEDRPNNIDVNKMLAEIYYAMGDMQKTETHLKLAMQTGSKDPEMKCLEGILLAKNNHQVEGTKIIQAVFVDVPYLDCSFCKDAKAIIL
jgi:tetratricopeptide (TPR) repeat protein